MDVMDYLAGQRFHPDWTRLGGAMADLPDEETFIKLVKRVIHELLPPAIDDLEGLLNKNRIFRDRTEGIGAVTHDEAIAWSLSGPVARASGVKRDVRKDEPYLCFADNWDKQGAEKVDFKVPVATTGDVFGRYLVRLEEIRQSIHIIEQLIDDIPGGPMNTWADGKVSKPSKGEVYGSIEGLIEHFELVMTNRKWTSPIKRDPTAASRAPTASTASTWSPTAGPSPGGPSTGRAASSTSRLSGRCSRGTCSPTRWRSWVR